MPKEEMPAGALPPALPKTLVSGWATSKWAISETSRVVRFSAATAAGRKPLETGLAGHNLAHDTIQTVFESA